MESMRSFPAATLLRDCRKLAFAMSPYEAHDLINALDFDRRLRSRLPWEYAAILIGLPFSMLLRRRDWGQLAGPVTIGALVIAIQVVFYASARQRLPLALPGIMAVAGIAKLLRHDASRASAALRLLGAGLALFLGLAWLTSPAQWQIEPGFSPIASDHPSNRTDRLSRTFWTAERFVQKRSRQRSSRRMAVRFTLRGEFADALKTMEPVTSGALSASPVSRKDASFWSARASLALDDRARAKRFARQAIAALPMDLRSQALWLALDWNRRDIGDGMAWRPSGADSVSARVALARELSFNGHRDVALRLTATVVSGFPELAGKWWP